MQAMRASGGAGPHAQPPHIGSETPTAQQQQQQHHHHDPQKGCFYICWLFVCQVYALVWKQFLLKKRRPLGTLFEIIAPSLMFLALVYGTQLSPTVQIPPFVYDAVPVVEANIVPNTTIPSTADAAFQALLEAAKLFDVDNPTSIFDTLLIPLIDSANSSVAEQLALLLLANSGAAKPFILPTFDGFIALILAQQQVIAKAGRKMLQYLVPMVWQAMHLGKLAFVVDGFDPTAAAPAGPTPAVVLETLRLMQYMNATSFFFATTLLCRPGAGQHEGCLFATDAAALADATQSGTTVWAYIHIHALDPLAAPPLFDYTLRINATLVPATTDVVNRFPKGLGENYAQYIYSGFATLELEFNEYFAHLVYARRVGAGQAQGAFPMNYDLIDLFQSACNTVLNETSLFPRTTDPAQQAVLDVVLHTIPAPSITLYLPVTNFSTVMPCAAELVASGCGSAARNAAFNHSQYACLRNLSSANISTLGSSCVAAVAFVGQFAETLQQACGATADSFFTPPSVLGANSTCRSAVFGAAPAAQASAYGQLTLQTQHFQHPCASDIQTFCAGSGGTSAAASTFQCLYGMYLAKVGLSPLCAAIVVAIPQCIDDFATVCPFNPNTDMIPTAFPSACLHMQLNVLSATCLVTDLVSAFIEPTYAMTAVILQDPIDEFVCRTARKVDMAFQQGIAAGAFPAKGYGQNQFFANSGALMGLVVALAFLYPFVGHVRLIVQEREKGQRLYMMLIGVHHSAILTAYTLIGFATMFFVALVGSSTFGYVLTNVPASTVFSLFFMYGFSLIGLASLVASFCDSTRNAGAIAPFVLFILAIPSFADVGTISVFTSLFSPCVVIFATNVLIQFQQSTASAGEFNTDMQAASGVLLGLALFYFLLALIVEQLRVMATGIGVVGRLSALLRLKAFAGYRAALRPLRRTRAYTRLNNGDYVVDDTDIDDGGSAGGIVGSGSSTSSAPPGYQNFDNGTVAAPANAASRSQYHIGGVRSDDTTALDPSGSSATGRRQPQTLFEPPQSGWRSMLSLAGLTVSLTSTARRKVALDSVSGDLYAHRVNCIVGDTCSGKTTLMNILMGAASPSEGTLEIQGKPVTDFNRLNMGVCFQHDVFWDCLTVKEHLELVQLVKGNLNIEAQGREVATLLQTLQLEEKQATWATTLSSGTRRKLSVAMAFAGGSRLLFLDEPTAAVDPISKKCLWHLIESNLRDRCFVIATAQVEDVSNAHHIWMLSKGHLVASGSPSFIKRLGSDDGKLLSLCRGVQCNPQEITDTVLAHCPTAVLINNVGQEMIFRVPAANVPALPGLLGALERSAWSHDSLSTIAVSDHRLDDVFMRVTRQATLHAAQRPSSAASSRGGVGSEYRRMLRSEMAASSLNDDGLAVEYSSAEDDDDEDGTAQGRKRKSIASTAANITPQTMSNSIGTDREIQARVTGLRLYFAQVDGIVRLRMLAAVNDFGPSLLHFALPLFAILLAMQLLAFRAAPSSSLLLVPRIFGANDVLYTTSQNILQTSVFNDTTYLGSLNGRVVDGGPTSFVQAPPLVALANATSVDMSLALKASMDQHSTHRYGAFVFNDELFRMHIDVTGTNGTNTGSGGLFANFTNITLPWVTDTILHNTSSDHALPVFLSLLGAMRTQLIANLSTLPTINVRSHPVALMTPTYSVNRFVVQLISSILLLVPFTFFPSQFVAYIVRQRETGVFKTQTASNLSPAAYWTGHFTWNMIGFFLFSVISVIMYASMENSVLTSTSEVVYMCGVMLLYGCCVTWISFWMSRLFQRSATAQNGVTMFHFTCGFALVAAVNAVELLPTNVFTASAKDTNNNWAAFFRIMPTFALGEAFIKLSSMDLNRFLNQATTVKEQVGPSIRLMWLFPLYAALLIAYDTVGAITLRRIARDFIRVPVTRFLAERWRHLASKKAGASDSSSSRSVKPWEEGVLLTGAEEDATVAAERLAAAPFATTSSLFHTGTADPTRPGIATAEMWKAYGDVYAAQNVTFAVAPQECLVVIGVNGSGKSTMLRMVAGAETPSHGHVSLAGTPIYASSLALLAGRSQSGYGGDVPGVDVHSTPYMLLHTMALFRGIHFSKQREQHILLLLKMLGLLHIRHVPCGSLSVAVHRRVSVAMALVGFPKVVVLDEPSTGLDPVGRRQVWATLRAVPKDVTVLLSSQHVEDVGMLASRFLLMDHGKMRLIGTIADVKEHLFNALQVVVRLPRASRSDEGGGIRVGGPVSKEGLLAYMASAFPSSSLVEQHSGCVFIFKIELDAPASGSSAPRPKPTGPAPSAPAQPMLFEGATQSSRESAQPQLQEQHATLRHVYETLSAQCARWASGRGGVPATASAAGGASDGWQALADDDDSDEQATREHLEVDVSLSSMDMLLSDALGQHSPAIVAAKTMLNSGCVIHLRDS